MEQSKGKWDKPILYISKKYILTIPNLGENLYLPLSGKKKSTDDRVKTHVYLKKNCFDNVGNFFFLKLNRNNNNNNNNGNRR